MYIYAEKETEAAEETLEEKVVLKLARSIYDKNVLLYFIRCFRCVDLLDTIKFPTVGTVAKDLKTSLNYQLN